MFPRSARLMVAGVRKTTERASTFSYSCAGNSPRPSARPRIELGQIEEPAVAQAGQDPALDQQNRALDLGLVARVRRARGQHRAAVVTSEFLVGPVGLPVIA